MKKKKNYGYRVLFFFYDGNFFNKAVAVGRIAFGTSFQYILPKKYHFREFFSKVCEFKSKFSFCRCKLSKYVKKNCCAQLRRFRSLFLSVKKKNSLMDFEKESGAGERNNIYTHI